MLWNFSKIDAFMSIVIGHISNLFTRTIHFTLYYVPISAICRCPYLPTYHIYLHQATQELISLNFMTQTASLHDILYMSPLSATIQNPNPSSSLSHLFLFLFFFLFFLKAEKHKYK